MSKQCPEVRPDCARVVHEFSRWATRHGTAQIAEFKALNTKIDGIDTKLNMIAKVVVGNGNVEQSLATRVARTETAFKIILALLACGGGLVALIALLR